MGGFDVKLEPFFCTRCMCVFHGFHKHLDKCNTQADITDRVDTHINVHAVYMPMSLQHCNQHHRQSPVIDVVYLLSLSPLQKCMSLVWRSSGSSVLSLRALSTHMFNLRFPSSQRF